MKKKIIGVVGSILLLYGLFGTLRFFAFGIWKQSFDRGYLFGAITLAILGIVILVLNYRKRGQRGGDE